LFPRKLTYATLDKSRSRAAVNWPPERAAALKIPPFVALPLTELDCGGCA
jgi:hypothetical protein